MKCDKCGYVSFDSNLTCPGCKRDLAPTRSRLGINLQPPEADLEEFFTGMAGGYTSGVGPAQQEEGAELDIDAVGEDFEFTLDD